MNDAIVKIAPDELEEVKINILQTWGDLEHVIKYSDQPSTVEALGGCAKNHVDYLWHLVTGEHLDGQKSRGAIRQPIGND